MSRERGADRAGDEEGEAGAVDKGAAEVVGAFVGERGVERVD